MSDILDASCSGYGGVCKPGQTAQKEAEWIINIPGDLVSCVPFQTRVYINNINAMENFSPKVGLKQL